MASFHIARSGIGRREIAEQAHPDTSLLVKGSTRILATLTSVALLLASIQGAHSAPAEQDTIASTFYNEPSNIKTIVEEPPQSIDHYLESIARFSEHNPSVDPIQFQWHWQNTEQELTDRSVNARIAVDKIELGRVDSYKISYSLSYPLQAMHSYLSPRLEYALNQINSYSDEVRYPTLSQAFSSNGEDETSILFWDAYNQYQADALLHLLIAPCEDLPETEQPCVRPDYTQLVFDYRAELRQLAIQLRQESIVESISYAQNWVQTIPEREEQRFQFFSPISVLLHNAADSDEKAVLLASVVSTLVPDSTLYMIYRSSQNGSASPAWLAIDASSGAQGERVIINNTEHVLLTGSAQTLIQMQEKQVDLISERLY